MSFVQTLLSKSPDLQQRIKTAVVLIAVFAVVLLLATTTSFGPTLFSILVLVLILQATWEYVAVEDKDDLIIRFSQWLILSFPPILGAITLHSYSAAANAAILLGACSFALVLAIFRISLFPDAAKTIDALFETFSRCTIGLLLLSLGGGTAVLLAYYSPLATLYCVLTVIVADSTAYFAGRSFGKAPVAAIVSPKKTVEGTVAGFVCATILGSFFALLLLPGLSWAAAALLSAAVALSSQAGDFIKSLVKRRLGLKDFGSILPGHGGVVDRLDGMLGAAPLVFALVALWNL